MGQRSAQGAAVTNLKMTDERGGLGPGGGPRSRTTALVSISESVVMAPMATTPFVRSMPRSSLTRPRSTRC